MGIVIPRFLLVSDNSKIAITPDKFRGYLFLVDSHSF
nr:MAG TPA: hypothetical protein [Caudoviricetes sp.]